MLASAPLFVLFVVVYFVALGCLLGEAHCRLNYFVCSDATFRLIAVSGSPYCGYPNGTVVEAALAQVCPQHSDITISMYFFLSLACVFAILYSVSVCLHKANASTESYELSYR
jgi:hypothetical protein